MTPKWLEARIDGVAEEVRDSVDPSTIKGEVTHWSIPVLDATGGPAIEEASSIGSAKIRLRGGEVLVSRLNPRKARVIRVPQDLEGIHLCSGEFVVLRPARVDPRFLEYLLLSESTRQHLDSRVQSVTRSHQRIRPELVRHLRVPMPDSLAQQAIADYLDTETARIDALIAKKQSLLGLLDDRRRGVIDGLTVPESLGGRADQGGENGWTVVPLKRTASFFTDGDWIESPFITSEGIRLIQTGNVGEGTFRDKGDRYISEATFHQLRCTEVDPGDVLISRLAGTVGFACLAPDLGTRMVTSVDVVILRPDAAVHAPFLVHYMSSTRHLALAQLLARGTTMQRMARSQVGEMPVPVPAIEVQRQIASAIDSAVSSIEQLRRSATRQLQLLVEHRQALITAAVTGELEVPGVAAA